MFKKTLMAAALAAATGSAFAGDIVVSGTAYKVGNEYLNAYTGSALEGNLETAAIGIAYFPGIALGVNNTLKFEFNGGAISADTGLKLQKITAFATHADNATIQTAIDTAVDAVVELAPADTAGDLANLKAAAISAITDAEAADETVDGTAAKTAINAELYDTNFATTVANIKGLNTAITSTVIPTNAADAADLVDFGTDANGDYTWALFKITDATLTADEVLVFNDTNDDGAANITTNFTKATIGTGDLTVSLPEAKDDTGVSLSAPVAGAEVLVTTANQFALTATAVTDTIDVEQDRLFFSDAIGDDVTTDFVFDITVDGTIDLGIDHTTAEFAMELTGNFSGVEQADYTETDLVGTDDTAVFDADNMVEGVGISDATVAITVDGDTNLATRTVKASMMITPTETDTEAFYLLGSSSAGANAFIWDLNGSEITFPYAPLGYDHITTNFELANSGDQEGDVLITAFTREGVAYSGTLEGKAEAESLTKISGAEVYGALGLAAGTSLSVTFSTTAPDADIKITGYSNLASGGRMALLSDAYEGESDKANCVLTGTAGNDDLAITCN
ncbi:hypothetical protein Q4489_05735 [Thalassotalea sp. 1_MG-2023]|uniref:hypothetical protein n=1 Tax=Thalassotalea sp. 1_MG-2023 TaxID=3062680 RepID=UPI0026E34FF4|nr:hypothetical protein [Thalassotalea sp. 1_MG-2023]MDO6426504.1 hypothetical protein [Thalassotalea sp. 1_MG-2023]